MKEGSDMNTASPKNYIRYETERVDFSLTGEELETLKNSSQNSWKDFCIGSFAVGVPCLINAISEINKQDSYRFNIHFHKIVSWY